MNVEFCENGGKHELEYKIADVVIMDGGALILGTGHYKRTEPGGEVSLDSDYTFTEVIVKKDDAWKIKHTHIGMIVEMGDDTSEATE